MLSITNMSIHFLSYTRVWKRSASPVITDLHLQVKKGEVFALFGSSGAGKSLLAHALLGILPVNARISGRITFKDRVMNLKTIESLRGKEIALVPQSVLFLDPLMSVGNQIIRAGVISGLSKAASKDAMLFHLERYGLDKQVQHLFPFQLSGGMARRIMIAIASVTNADLIIADEPTTGLDDENIQKTLAHLKELADKNRAIIVITHNLKAALNIADTVGILYGGTMVEIASSTDFIDSMRVRHPYTKALWNALPQHSFSYIRGKQPVAGMDCMSGCVFADRCPECTVQCKESIPLLQPVNNRMVRCFYA